MSAALHIHLDPLGGLAGDMFVAALLDALPELERPVREALRVVLPDTDGFALTRVRRHGLAGALFAPARPPNAAPVTFTALRQHIADAGLAPPVRDEAIAILTLLAEAEAEVHDTPLGDVHFHEIGEWDTVADCVAAGAILVALPESSWSLAPLPLGGGRIRCAHGTLPVPAPATAQLLTGLAVHDDGIDGERVTPTGAAIAAHLARGRGLGPRPGGVLRASGRGAGSRNPAALANLLFAQAIDATTALPGDAVTVLAFEIDDMSGEEIAQAAERLRAEAGTRDLVLRACIGKKGRPATTFELLVEPAAAESVIRACFLQTATIGLRRRDERRVVLERELLSDPPAKRVRRPDGHASVKIESDALSDGETLAARRAAARAAEHDR